MDERNDYLMLQDMVGGTLGEFIVLDLSGPILLEPSGETVDVGTTIRIALRPEDVVPLIHVIAASAHPLEEAEDV